MSQLAGGSTHLETQLGGNSRNCRRDSYALLHRQTPALAQHGCIPYWSYSLHKKKNTHTPTHRYAHTQDLLDAWSLYLNFHLQCPALTRPHTLPHSLYWPAPWNCMVILHYGSTVIWGMRGGSGHFKRTATHTNTDRPGYCKCV